LWLAETNSQLAAKNSQLLNYLCPNFYLNMIRLLIFSLLCTGFFSCTPNNVKIDDSLGTYFKQNGVDGCFAIVDNKNGKFTMYNLGRYRDSAFLPASTFKIVNSLIGLQTGVIRDENMVIPWDGVPRSMTTWNRDLTMREAFRVSAVPYYQEVARRIGKDTMQKWLDTLAYGSKKITTRIDTFWLDNSLRITPDEELGLVRSLYFNKLPFYNNHQDAVKSAMLFEDKPEYKLSYKTGMGYTDSTRKRLVSWVVGWIEENNHPHFFVLNFETTNAGMDVQAVRLKMLKDILGHLGFLKGKK
jgi:beta-lactamase class D